MQTKLSDGDIVEQFQSELVRGAASLSLSGFSVRLDEYLAAQGADPAFADDLGRTLVHLTVLLSQPYDAPMTMKAVRLLLDKGCPPGEAIVAASVRGDANLVTFLGSRGPGSSLLGRALIAACKLPAKGGPAESVGVVKKTSCSWCRPWLRGVAPCALSCQSGHGI